MTGAAAPQAAARHRVASRRRDALRQHPQGRVVHDAPDELRRPTAARGGGLEATHVPHERRRIRKADPAAFVWYVRGLKPAVRRWRTGARLGRRGRHEPADVGEGRRGGGGRPDVARRLEGRPLRSRTRSPHVGDPASRDRQPHHPASSRPSSGEFLPFDRSDPGSTRHDAPRSMTTRSAGSPSRNGPRRAPVTPKDRGRPGRQRLDRAGERQDAGVDRREHDRSPSRCR